MNLEPTHTCFDDALDFLNLMVLANRVKLEEWRLVHALCRFEGQLYAHAWCERNGETVMAAYVIDGKHTYVETDRAGHYEIFQPVEVWSYSVREAAGLNLRHGHFGPWEPELRKHCTMDGSRRIFGSTTIKVEVHP